MSPKQHYDEHLSSFYSWMMGDFDTKSVAFQDFLKEQNIHSEKRGLAVDLGAGHGIQSIALNVLGFEVLAIDFSRHLLEELRQRNPSNSIKTIEGDIRKVSSFLQDEAELIVCCGDTLTHLDNKEEIESLIRDCSTSLMDNGKLILSFRDYSTPLADEQRFIPVRSDSNRIHTCFLEYEDERVRVSDLLHEKNDGLWVQKVSAYYKVRISTADIVQMIERAGLKIMFNQDVDRMQTIIAMK